MKTLLLLFASTITLFACAQSDDEKKLITKTITAYAGAGDAQHVANLSATLHDSYRLVWYGGKDAPFISDKNAFLSQFEKKEWGGDERKVSITSIEVIDGCNASAKAVLDGTTAEMRCLFSLIKVGEQWQIIGELVNASFK